MNHISFITIIMVYVLFKTLNTYFKHLFDIVQILYCVSGCRPQGFSTCYICKNLAVARFTQKRAQTLEILPICF